MKKIKLRRLPLFVALFILVALIPTAIYLARHPQTAEAAWYNNAWAYRQIINFTNAGGIQSNVYITLTLNTTLPGRFKPSCGDMRFTKADNTLLSYYIVSGCGTMSTIVHVNYASLPAGSQTVYWYYGNPAAADGFVGSDFSSAAGSITIGNFNAEEKNRQPILYFKLDDGYGTTTSDSSSNKLTGTLNNTTWTTEDQCITGKCLSFNGTSASVTVATSVLNVQSVSLWVKPQTNSQSILDLDGGTHTITASNGTITSAGFTALYVNGQVGTTLTANVWQHLEATTTTPFTASSIKIGNVASAYLNGYVDDFKLYDYQRTAAQVETDAVRSDAPAGAATVLGAQSTDPLTQGLVGYWKMDEATWSGTLNEVVDSSGNGSNGTVACVGTSCAKPTTAGGKFGNGGSFGANSTETYVSATLNAAPSNFTISAWIKLNEISREQHFAEITNFQFFLNSGSNKIDCGPGSAHYAQSTKTLATGQWYQVVCTYSNSNWQTYINGNSDGSLTGYSYTPSSSVVIGDFYSHVAGLYVNGMIDDVRIYNRALSASEVSQLYNWAPGPIGWWKFDENTGTTAYDSSGNNNNGTINNLTWTLGKFGSALMYPNLSSKFYDVQIPDNAVLDNVTSAITGEFWIKPNANLTGYNGQWLEKNYPTAWGISSNATGNNNLSLWMNNTDVVDSPDNVYPVGSWSHIAFTYDKNAPGTQQVKLYVNGVLVTTANYTAAIGTNNSYLDIGQYGQDYPMNGAIDDVRIYNYARSQAQIVQDMNGGHPAGNDKSLLIHYDFDENNGVVANNTGTGGSTDNGTISNGTWSTSGKVNNALSFAANTSVTTTVTDPGYVNTLSVWLYPITSVASKTLVTAGKLTTDSSARPVYGSCVGTALPLNTWTHVVAVSNGSGSCTIYQNGTLSASGSTGVSFGTSVNLGGSSYLGLMDDFKLYTYPLAANDVLIDYHQGNSAILSQADSTLGNPPIGWWKFDENTGTIAHDSSGNNNNVTLNANFNYNTDSGWTAGKYGSALQFDGVDDVAQSPSNTLFDLAGSSGFTVETWVKADTLSSTVNSRLITEKTDTSNGYHLAIISSSSGTCGSRFIFEVDKAGTYYSSGCSTSNSAVVPKTWYHLVATFDGTGNTAQLYVNGVPQVAGASQSLGLGVTHYITFASQSTAGTNLFDGSFDDTKIFNYVRSTAQIAQDYNRGAPFAWYDFNECIGSTLHNSAVNANGQTAGYNGTIVPNTGRTTGNCSSGIVTEMWNGGTTGKYGGSLAFDGAGDYVSGNSFNLGGQGTISAWIKTASSNSGIIFQEVNTGANTYLWAYVDNYISDHPRIGIYIGQTSPTIQNQFIRGSNLDDNKWHFLVWQSTGTAYKLYVDGVEQTTSTYAYGNNDGTWYSSLSGINQFNIGRNNRNGDNNNYFNGQIDDLRIYNYALTPDQIRMIYNNGAVSYVQ